MVIDMGAFFWSLGSWGSIAVCRAQSTRTLYLFGDVPGSLGLFLVFLLVFLLLSLLSLHLTFVLFSRIIRHRVGYGAHRNKI